MDTTRVDKWLWAARMFKTRTLATKACDAGHVEIDGSGAKASSKVKAGMMIDVRTPGGPRILEVVAIADKRGPASVAQTLYVDHTPPPEPKSPFHQVMDETRERGMGRPTKRDRRRLGKLKRR
ncbi:MAG: RNA-binding S4 domain-containing protein [Proteobacteria bacterium]|nr:RNA-binding S4 domain-containing protein [Pseudomonadota bacterium]MCP4916925.1 RNA-binding S4 domain-containing protein [Pseudomonadota bacterium]